MSSYMKRMRLERWQLRRKSINISCQDVASTSTEIQLTKTNSKLNNSSRSKQNDEPAEMPVKASLEASSSSASSSSEKGASNRSSSKLTSQQQKQPQQQQLHHFQLKAVAVAAPIPLSLSPILLLLLSIFFTMILISLTGEQVKAAAPDLIAKRESTAASLMRGLIQQLVSLDYSDRWTSLPSFPSLQSQLGARDPANGGGPAATPGRPASRLLLRRALARLRNRIGARNSIRVHNAFRDLAWRLLSSLSMPTPIIYEIRRQHLYSQEDDTLNDSLYNKNTTKTIRSRRHLDLHPTLKPKLPRADQEHDSLTSRARAKLEDLLSPERRRQSLFGRMVRFPAALFSFKRQQQDEGPGNEDQDSNATVTPSAATPDDDTSDNDDDKRSTTKFRSTNSHTLRKRPISRLLQRRRRKKDPDRQMISIDGKQYYVNDEGQLKELPENEQ